MTAGWAMLGFTAALVIAPVSCAFAQEGPLLDPAQRPIDIHTPRASAPVRAAKPAAPKAAARKPTPAVVAAPAAVAEKAPEPARPAPEPAPPFDEAVIAKYCNALSVAASDGRLAWQARQIAELEAQLRARIAELDEKRAELETWLKRRDELRRKAQESLVGVYEKMKPDAAAANLSAMDESGAAAILSKVNPRFAGSVLNEIDAQRAARIAAEMAGVQSAARREILRSVP